MVESDNNQVKPGDSPDKPDVYDELRDMQEAQATPETERAGDAYLDANINQHQSKFYRFMEHHGKLLLKLNSAMLTLLGTVGATAIVFGGGPDVMAAGVGLVGLAGVTHLVGEPIAEALDRRKSNG